MTRIAVFTFLLLLLSFQEQAQTPSKRSDVLQNIDTSRLDMKALAGEIVGDETNNFQKARKLLYWLSSHFEWKSTDYKTRTINEIIARGGGNCFELARLYTAFIRQMNIKYRTVAEINLQGYSEDRQRNASEKVKEKGNNYSVFGLQHNDHRWIEVYDEKSGSWEPADPSMGVIGTNDWLKARIWFGERKTIDTAISNSMIAPFAIFITGEDKMPYLSRSQYYLIDQFDELYSGRLSKLPSWPQWVQLLKDLETPAMNAFLGKENLHRYQLSISRLSEVYQQLKKEYEDGNR